MESLELFSLFLPSVLTEFAPCILGLYFLMHMFIIVRLFDGFNLLHHKDGCNLHSLSLVTIFVRRLILSDISVVAPALLLVTFVHVFFCL